MEAGGRRAHVEGGRRLAQRGSRAEHPAQPVVARQLGARQAACVATLLELAELGDGGALIGHTGGWNGWQVLPKPG